MHNFQIYYSVIVDLYIFIVIVFINLAKDHHTNYTLPNYIFEQTFRPKARGGGVCLYIHSSLQYKMRRDLIPTNQNIIKHSKHH